MKEASARKIEQKVKKPEENESLGSLTFSSDEESGNWWSQIFPKLIYTKIYQLLFMKWLARWYNLKIHL